MPYLKHIFFDLWAGLLQSSPKIIAIIIILKMHVNPEMEKLRKISIYTIMLTVMFPFFIQRILSIFNCDSREMYMFIYRSVDFIFLVTLSFFMYKRIKYNKEKK